MKAQHRFILNAILDGWSVTRTAPNTFKFIKKHYNIKEYFDSMYIETFIDLYK